MCDSEQLSRQHADARVLVTLLHLRDIADRTGADFTIVSEILEEADRELTRVANVDDIILSEQVTSYLLAQISENRDLAEVFDELFQAEGSEIYMRPVEAYVTGDGGFVRDAGGGGPAPRRDRVRLPNRGAGHPGDRVLRRSGQPDQVRAVHRRARRPPDRARRGLEGSGRPARRRPSHPAARCGGFRAQVVRR